MNSEYTQFLPAAVLRRHQADPQPPVSAAGERLRGVLLVADVMGYTALTERYSQRAEGVEELKDLLESFFGRLNELILNHGGDIISFAGDSVFAVWNAADSAAAAARAAQCGLAAQQALDRCDLGDGLVLRMRVVIAAGDLMLATVGGFAGKWHCLATGQPLAGIGAGLAQAEAGSVVVDAQARGDLGDSAQCQALSDGYARVIAVAPGEVSPAAAPQLQTPAGGAMRCYIAKPVLDQIDAGLFAWLTEFRRVTTAFIRVRGIDYAAADALAQLHEATRAVQAAVARYDGSFQRAIVDEKGTNLLCVWGLPGHHHEDDPVRAVTAGFAIRRALQAQGRDCGIGITTGRVMCGLSGGGGRYEYTVVGDAVNLAARLMAPAGDGMLCDSTTAEATRMAFTFEAPAPLRVKGKTDALMVWRPLAETATAERRSAPPRLARFLGRRSEIATLQAQLKALQAGTGGVVVIEGEPGVGKSQLIAEFQRTAAASGTVFLLGHADSIERSTTYFAWREVLRQVLDRATLGAEAQRLYLETLCDADPVLKVGLPLLGDILPLGFVETATVRGMSEQVRADNTQALLLHVLQQVVAAQPTVIVLEDAHWMDSMSWILAAQLFQRELPLLLVLVTRSGYVPDTEQGRALQAAASARLNLATFSREDTEALVCDRLRVAGLPAAALELIYSRTDGHPLFSEELAYSLRDAGYLTVRDGQCAVAAGEAGAQVPDLPATIDGIIAGRVDRLSAGEQLTLKVASVFGRNFAAGALADVHPVNPGREALAAQLDKFMALDLVHAQTEADASGYQFKHIITQEVTYGLLAFAQRRELHRAVALWHERGHADDLAAVYPLLAHHWSRASDPPRAFHFLHKAGEQAFLRYANQEAVGFLSDALAVNLPQPDIAGRAACLRLLGYAWLWLGRPQESRAHLESNLALLGHAIPATQAGLYFGIAKQFALRLVLHVLGRRFIKHTRAESDRRIAETIIRYTHIAYFMTDTPRMIYASLRSLNFADRAELSSEVAVIYAAMVSGAAAMPLHGLAQRYCAQAVEAANAVREPAVTAQVLLFNSLYFAGIGDWAQCIAPVDQAAKLSRSVGDFRRYEECLVIGAYLRFFTGRFAAALQGYEAGAASGRRRGDRQITGWGSLGIARVRLAQGRADAALAALRDAAPAITDRLGGIEMQGMSALAHLQSRQFEQALHDAREGLRLILESRPISFSTLSGSAGVATTLVALWAYARGGGAPDRPEVLKREARRALKALRRFARVYPIGWPQCLLIEGHFQYVAGRKTAALKAWRQAAGRASELDMPYEEALAHHAIARHAGGSEGTVAHASAAALFETLGVSEPAPVYPSFG